MEMVYLYSTENIEILIWQTSFKFLQIGTESVLPITSEAKYMVLFPFSFPCFLWKITPTIIIWSNEIEAQVWGLKKR